MKKIFSVLLLLVVMFVLVVCDNIEGNGNDKNLVIIIGVVDVIINVGDEFDLMNNVKVEDIVDGNIIICI